jgi:small-conductance mechanosensitive channel
MSWLERFVQTIESTLGLSSSTIAQLIATALVIAAYVVAQRIARRIIARWFEEPGTRFMMTKVLGYALWSVVFLIIIRIWIQAATGFATYLGLLSAGLAIALQDPLANLAAWIFILVRRPVKIGHRIQIGAHIGDVVDIRPFRFVMLEIGNWVHADQSTGRVLHIPNGWVFKYPVANYDEAFGYIWNELEVTLTLESSWRHAKTVLTEILDRFSEERTEDAKKRIDAAAETFHLRFTKLTPVVWTSVVDSGIRLTMRYLCEPRDRRTSASELWEAVLDAFAEMPDVELAYPTTRFFDNMVEGKAGARAPAASPASVGPPAPPRTALIDGKIEVGSE